MGYMSENTTGSVHANIFCSKIYTVKTYCQLFNPVCTVVRTLSHMHPGGSPENQVSCSTNDGSNKSLLQMCSSEAMGDNLDGLSEM